jgi:bacterioferritin-associated ferredoxin
MHPPDQELPDEVMCHCSGTTRDHIRRLFAQGMDIQAISRHTGALTGCGGCKWDIALFLDELAAQRDNPAKA